MDIKRIKKLTQKYGKDNTIGKFVLVKKGKAYYSSQKFILVESTELPDGIYDYLGDCYTEEEFDNILGDVAFDEHQLETLKELDDVVYKYTREASDRRVMPTLETYGVTVGMICHRFALLTKAHESASEHNREYIIDVQYLEVIKEHLDKESFPYIAFTMECKPSLIVSGENFLFILNCRIIYK